MRRSIARLSASVPSRHTQFSVAFTTNIAEFNFRYTQPSRPVMDVRTAITSKAYRPEPCQETTPNINKFRLTSRIACDIVLFAFKVSGLKLMLHAADFRETDNGEGLIMKVGTLSVTGRLAAGRFASRRTDRKWPGSRRIRLRRHRSKRGRWLRTRIHAPHA